MQSRFAYSALAVLAVSFVAVAGSLPSAHAQSSVGIPAVGNPYLVLIRNPIVHAELRVTDQQKQAITRVTDELDGPLLALRGQTPEKGRDALGHLIADAQAKMRGILTAGQQKRLSEILLRAQGIRGLLRSDVASQMTLTTAQIDQIQAEINDTDKAVQAVRQQAEERESEAWFAKQVARLRKEEQKNILALLNDSQRTRLVELVGRPFDTSRLGQSAFKSPEISMASVWINSAPLSLSALRGKVVAVHFWAFG